MDAQQQPPEMLFKPYSMDCSVDSWNQYTCPFMCNVEFSDGSMVARRGLAEVKADEDIPDSYTEKKAVATTCVEADFNGNSIVVELTFIKAKDDTGKTVNLLHANTVFKDIVSPYKITSKQLVIPEDFIINNIEKVGIQAQVFPLSITDGRTLTQVALCFGAENGIYPGNTNYSFGTAVLNIFETPNNQDLEYGLDSPPYALANTPDTVPVLDDTWKRSFAFTNNRAYFSVKNVIYFNKTVNISGVNVNIDGFAELPSDVTIIKIIPFSNAIYIICDTGVFLATVVANSVLNFYQLVSGIFTANRQGVLTVSNYAYIATVSDNIYKFNLKNDAIEIAGYSTQIGGPVRALVRGARPVSSYFDAYNGTVNFVYSGNLNTLSHVMDSSPSGRSREMNESNSNSISAVGTVIISKSHSSDFATGEEEKWTCSVYNMDIAGAYTFRMTRTKEQLRQMLDAGSSSMTSSAQVEQDDLVTLDATADVEFDEIYMRCVGRYNLKRMQAVEGLKGDVSAPFKCIIAIPLCLTSKKYLAQQKVYDSANCSLVFSTGSRNSKEILSPDLRNENIIYAKTAEMTSNFRHPPVFQNANIDSAHMVTDTEISNIISVNHQVNSSLFNGAVFFYVSSEYFDTFLGYRVEL